MKKWIVTLCVLAAAGAAGTFYYRRAKPAEASSALITATLARGNVVEAVQATGTLEAVTTVQVGSQVSGSIKALHADFNSQVRQGQVVAELEQSLFQAQVEQASATLTRLQADRDRARVQVEDAQIKLKRARELSARQLLAASDLDTAESTARQAEAALKSAEAQIVQARASLNQTQVNLSYTIIKAPIDGIVVSRNVDVGQTVAASMQAPTLFVLAKDLAQMQVSAAIDESDIGRIHAGQSVTFKVDAYPDDVFTGTVRQVRLQPVVTQNVVSYTTIITVPNPTLKLRPGMTASVTVEISRADNVVRMPSAALRFRLTPELFASLGQPAPAGGFGGPGGARGGAGAANGATPPVAAPGVPAPGGAPARSAGTGGTGGAEGARAVAPSTPGGASGGGRFANLSPEERDAFRQRMQNASPEERQRMREERRTTEGRAPAASGSDRGGAGGSGGDASAPGGRFGNMSPEERDAFRQRMQNMTPEAREAFRQRMREGGGPAGSVPPGAGPRTATPLVGGRRAPVGGRNGAPAEAVVAPIEPPKITVRPVWLLRDGKLERAVVRVSISDGVALAVVDGPVQEGDVVVTGMTQPAAQAQGAGNPLMPFGGQRFPGGGGFGGAGGGNANRNGGAGAAGGGAGRR